MVSDGAGPKIPGERWASWRVAALFLALTLLFTYPLWLDPGGSVIWQGSDTELFAWTLSWDVHALVHRPWAIFDANVFFPQARTLAYSENLIGSALLAAPVLWLTGNPVAAINTVALLACLLCGLGGYVLARRVGIGPAGATIAGIVFAFSPPRFFRIGQLHLAAVQWVPFGLASLHSYLDSGRRRDLRLAAAFLTLQTLSSGHGTVFLGLSMIGLCAYRVALGEPVAFRRRLADLGVPGVALLLPAVFVAFQYHAVQREVGLTRTLSDWVRTNGASFLFSPSHVDTFIHARLPGRLDPPQADLFPGWLPLLLAPLAFVRLGGRTSPAGTARSRWLTRSALTVEVAALVALALAAVISATGPVRLRIDTLTLLSARSAWRAWSLAAALVAARAVLARWVPFGASARVRRTVRALWAWPAEHRRDAAPFYGLVAAVSLWLALPLDRPFGLWPLVYGLPGFNFIRVPSRFTLLTLLALAVLAGFAFERLTAGLQPRRRSAAGVILGVLLVVEFAAMPLSPAKYRADIPAVDRWLATRAGRFAVAEVPMADPDGDQTQWERRQSTYMLHSTAHWQGTIHGFSGTRPQMYDELYASLVTFPDENSLQALSRLGVTRVVVHTDLYPPGEWSRVQARIAQFHDHLWLEQIVGPGLVYALR
jgi:hypothetical protein